NCLATRRRNLTHKAASEIKYAPAPGVSALGSDGAAQAGPGEPDPDRGPGKGLGKKRRRPEQLVGLLGVLQDDDPDSSLDRDAFRANAKGFGLLAIGTFRHFDGSYHNPALAVSGYDAMAKQPDGKVTGELLNPAGKLLVLA